MYTQLFHHQKNSVREVMVDGNTLWSRNRFLGYVAAANFFRLSATRNTLTCDYPNCMLSIATARIVDFSYQTGRQLGGNCIRELGAFNNIETVDLSGNKYVYSTVISNCLRLTFGLLS